MSINYITIERNMEAAEQRSRTRCPKPVRCHAMEEDPGSSIQGVNVPIERIEKYEENSTGSFLYSMYALSRAGSGESDLLSLEGHVFVEEQKVIQKMAANGRAIFLGHCASEA